MTPERTTEIDRLVLDRYVLKQQLDQAWDGALRDAGRIEAMESELREVRQQLQQTRESLGSLAAQANERIQQLEQALRSLRDSVDEMSMPSFPVIEEMPMGLPKDCLRHMHFEQAEIVKFADKVLADSEPKEAK